MYNHNFLRSGKDELESRRKVHTRRGYEMYYECSFETA